MNAGRDGTHAEDLAKDLGRGVGIREHGQTLIEFLDLDLDLLECTNEACEVDLTEFQEKRAVAADEVPGIAG